MRKLYFVAFLAVASLAASAQMTSTFHVGAVGSVYKNGNAVGGEIGAMSQIVSEFSLGGGVQVLTLEGQSGMYVPIFISLGYTIFPRLMFHADPGYSAFSKSNTTQSGLNQTRGDFFIGYGFRYNVTKCIYAGAQYSLYQIATSTNKSAWHKTDIHAVTFSLGYSFNQ